MRNIVKFGFMTPIIALVMAGAFIIMMPGKSAAQTGGSVFIQNDVAIVNGVAMTEKELLFNLIRKYGEETIYDMIEDEIICSQAEGMGVTLDPNDVVEYLAAAYAPEKLSTLIDAFGEDILEQTVGTQLLALKIVTDKIDLIVAEHGIEITDVQARQYYQAYLPMWTTPESVRFSMIETATEADALDARRRILAGESFVDVCRDVSTHAGTRAYGGDIGGNVPRGYSTGDKALIENTAFDLEVNQTSQPIQVDNKWYLVMPTEKTAYSEPAFDEMEAYIRASIKDEIVQPYLDEWMNGLVEQAQIEITYPILQSAPPVNFVPGAEGSFIAPTVGTVNGRPIEESAMLFHLLKQYGSDEIQTGVEDILLVQAAGEMGITVSEADVRNQIAEIYDAPTLNIIDSAFGVSAVNTTFMRYLVSLNALGTKAQEIVREQGLEVTEEQIRQYYLDNLHRWTSPEMVRFSLILLPTQAEAQAARQRITNGESFEDVCRNVSLDDGTRPYGGDIGAPLARGTATGENVLIEQTAFSLENGAVSQPFQVGDNWFIIKVTEKSPAYEPTLGDKRREISERLLADRIAPFITGWRSSLWANASINIVYPIFADIAPEG